MLPRCLPVDGVPQKTDREVSFLGDQAFLMLCPPGFGDARTWHSVSLPAACANRSRAIPHGQDTFEVQRSLHEVELARLMPVLEKAQASFGVRQAAIWIVTDNADYGDLGVLVSRGVRAISQEDTGAAMKLVAETGIIIINKRIWQDCHLILPGVKNANLRTFMYIKTPFCVRSVTCSSPLD
jgi:hypothetical protein